MFHRNDLIHHVSHSEYNMTRAWSLHYDCLSFWALVRAVLSVVLLVKFPYLRARELDFVMC